MSYLARYIISVVVVAFSQSCATGRPTGALSSRDLTYSAFQKDSRTASDVAAKAVVVAPPVTNQKFANSAEKRKAIVEKAKSLVGQKHVSQGRDDCSGLLISLFNAVGINLLSEAKHGDNAVKAIYRYAQSHGKTFNGGFPLPGDLVFFNSTYDQNRDGVLSDALTHVGLVEAIEADGTVSIIHRVQSGIVRYKMNLNYATLTRAADGRIINDALRLPKAGGKPVLTSQLFAGFATVLNKDIALAQR